MDDSEGHLSTRIELERFRDLESTLEKHPNWVSPGDWQPPKEITAIASEEKAGSICNEAKRPFLLSAHFLQLAEGRFSGSLSIHLMKHHGLGNTHEYPCWISRFHKNYVIFRDSNNFPKTLFFSRECFCQGKWSILSEYLFQNVLSVEMESSKLMK